MKKKSSTRVTKCRICKSSKLIRFLDLGKMPIPNGFLTADGLNKPEKSYELASIFCPNCSLVQLSKVVNPEIMFSNYVYVTSVSKSMLNNFAQLSFYAHKNLNINSKSLVVDIGSNDGSLLKFFKSYEAKVLGVDPAENLAKVAINDGVPTEIGLFNPLLARKIVKKYGQADLITATNVIAHIDNLDELFESIKILLKKDGAFITEFPYILDLISKNQFDTIYHEHLSYFGLNSWNYFIERQGFQISDVSRLLIHGGSIRTVHKFKNGSLAKKSKNVSYLLDLEAKKGLLEKKAYEQFADRVIALKYELNLKLNKIKKEGKRIVGLGAPAKGNVLTSFFDIGPEVLDYIIDSTPLKQGLYTPKKHIPIYSDERILKDQPDYALILAWNFKEEIMRKHGLFKKRGGKFIIPIPDVTII